MMKKYWKWVLVIVLLLLDFIALDDITTGNEPDYYGEYAMLVVSVVIFAWLVWRKIVLKTSKN